MHSWSRVLVYVHTTTDIPEGSQIVPTDLTAILCLWLAMVIWAVNMSNKQA